MIALDVSRNLNVLSNIKAAMLAKFENYKRINSIRLELGGHLRNLRMIAGCFWIHFSLLPLDEYVEIKFPDQVLG